MDTLQLISRVLSFSRGIIIYGDDTQRPEDILRAQYWRARAHGNLGHVYWEDNQFQFALRHYHKAADIFNRTGHTCTLDDVLRGR